MNKRFPIMGMIAASMVFSATANAQSATEGKVEHSNGKKAAAIIELPYPEDEVSDVIADALASKGIKGEKSKGFQIFRNAKLSERDADLNDLHFKIERKSRKEKDITLVYLLVGKPNENVGARSESDYHKIDEAKSYLNSMLPKLEAHHLELQIREQETTVQKAEKKFQSLVEDSVSYTDKIKALELKMQTNRTDRTAQTEEVKKQKATLEAMRARRKSK